MRAKTRMRRLAQSLVSKYGIGDWTVATLNPGNYSGGDALGVCLPLLKRLEFDFERIVRKAPEPYWHDIILHEVAHALSGKGHSDEWASEAIRIGVHPQHVKECMEHARARREVTAA